MILRSLHRVIDWLTVTGLPHAAIGLTILLTVLAVHFLICVTFWSCLKMIAINRITSIPPLDRAQ